VVECFNTALLGIGLASADPQAIRRTIGLSIPDSLASVAGIEHLGRVEEFRLHWRRRSDEIMVDWTRVFDWTAPVCEELSAAGFALGIVSTKYRDRILATLERNGLEGRFAVVIGGEDVERHKPDPEGLLTAIARLGVRAEETLYVGDTVADAAAARGAGTPFVGVLSGMTGEEAFAGFTNEGILAHIGELPGWVDRRAS
jgi:phosphoglycolate phosphatase